MKNTLIKNLSILAVLASFLVIPVSTVAAGIAFTFTGVIAMLVADYGRTIEPLTIDRDIAALKAAHRELADAPLAA
jgi:hypothetical protein